MKQNAVTRGSAQRGIKMTDIQLLNILDVCNAQALGKKLGIHPNTLRRLRDDGEGFDGARHGTIQTLKEFFCGETGINNKGEEGSR